MKLKGLIFLLLVAVGSSVFAQKRSLTELADEAFEAKQYVTAIDLYDRPVCSAPQASGPAAAGPPGGEGPEDLCKGQPGNVGQPGGRRNAPRFCAGHGGVE